MYFFFFNDTATTEIYTLSLHDALPISQSSRATQYQRVDARNTMRTPPSMIVPSATLLKDRRRRSGFAASASTRSEEHTSELQSSQYLVCRLLLEKKNL